MATSENEGVVATTGTAHAGSGRHLVHEAATSNRTDDELTLRELIADWKRTKLVFLLLIGCLTVAGVLYGLLGRKEYEATTVLQPVAEGAGSSRLGGLASRYSGLASLVGITLPVSGKKAEAVAVLQSELLTQRFIQKNDLMPTLFASKWNAKSHEWRTTDPAKTPTLWLANRKFKNKIRTVVNDKKTGMIDMTIKWTNAQDAAKWANGLVSMTNDYLRTKAILEAKRNIAYLNKMVSKTTVVAERQVIYALMEQQIDKEMIARDRKQYALKVIDPAFAPGKPSSGGPLFWGVLGLTFGIFLTAIAVFVRVAMAAA